MIKNYFILAFRNIKRNRIYSLINILGLSIGLASSLLIILFLRHELNADKHHEHYNNLYRLGLEMGMGGPAIKTSLSCYPLGPDLKNNFPEVIDFTRFYYADLFHSDLLLEYEQKAIYESGIVLADSNFLDFFTHPIIYGDAKASLRHNNIGIITRAAAQKIFGNVNPVGLSFRLNQEHNIEVGAVIEDIPDNSHLKFRVLLNWNSLEGMEMNVGENSYFYNNIYTYVKLEEGIKLNDFQKKLDEFIDSRTRNVFVDNNIEGEYKLHARPMKDLYFTRNEHYQPVNPEKIPATGHLIYVYVFIAIAVFLAVIAAINYMNMAIARSGKRSREVGVRKVLGAEPSGLIKQFLAESLVVAFLAFVLSLLLIEISLPVFNNLLMKNLKFLIFSDYEILLYAIGLTLIIGLFSGSYPAFYLSSFKPIAVLKQKVRLSDRNLNMRKVMVALQFTISVFMIIATLVVLGQMNYIRNKDLGYDTQNIMVLNLNDFDDEQRIALKNEIQQLSFVLGVSLSDNIPGPGYNVANNGVTTQTEDGYTDRIAGIYRADASFSSVFGMKIIEGRYFSKDLETDYDNSVIINQTAVRNFGWQDQPLGKKIMEFSGKDTIFKQVIGVVEDFHVYSVDHEIGPVVIFPEKAGIHLGIHIYAENTALAIKEVEKIFHKFSGNQPMRYKFMDETHKAAYFIHNNQGGLFAIFAFLCIFLSLMGLFGLSGFSAEQKGREIGIRRVHGASLANILSLLYREYTVLMGVSVVIASVSGYYFMDRWLSNFAFNTGLSFGPFFWAAFLAIAVSLLTVGFHAVRCCVGNPVETLKNDQ